jgi:hypothetical protein
VLDGLWPAGAAGGRQRTLIAVEERGWRDSWRTPAAYTILHSYWWLTHFSRHIPAKYRLVDVDAAVRDLVASAWMRHNGQL